MKASANKSLGSFASNLCSRKDEKVIINISSDSQSFVHVKCL